MSRILSQLLPGWSIEPGFANLIKTVPILDHDKKNEGGKYIIRIAARPPYCDRGDWQLFVDAEGASRLDGADGFPRYFFGTAEEAQKQMDTWINKRKEVIHANSKTETKKEE